MRLSEHLFEDEEGNEITLNPDLQYEVVWTGVGINDFELGDQEIPYPVFTHRVRLMRHQFLLNEEEGKIDVVDLEDVPDNLEGG